MIAAVVARLTHRFTDLAPEQVSSAVLRAHTQFEQSPIRDFVPLLVERRARNELSQRGG